MRVAVGPAPACGAALSLHSNLSRPVDPKGGGAGRGWGMGEQVASREGSRRGPHPTNIDTPLANVNSHFWFTA
jgi:hypothetical protein